MAESAKAPRKESQDDVSVTSTSEENEEPNDVFSLVGILAERQVGGNTMYLVEWEDYPISKATWEPVENFEDTTISKWTKFKRDSGRRTAPGFRVSDWKTAINEEVEAKRSRHETRNAKRTLQGRKPTEFRNFEVEYLRVLQESLENFEEPDDGLTASGASSAHATNADDPQDSTRTNTLVKAESSAAPCREARPGTAVQRQRQTTSQIPPRSSPDKDMASARTLAVHQPRKPALARGEQAGPCSPTTSAGPAKTRTLDRTTTINRSNHAFPASRDPHLETNVFAGGTTRKSRGTLLDAISDASRGPKMLRLRHQNIVQKGFRDREGLVAPANLPHQLIVLDRNAPRPEPTESKAVSGLGIIDSADDGVDILRDVAMTTGPPQNSAAAGAVPDQGVSGLWRPSESQPDGNKKQRKRSVRWSDTITVLEASDGGQVASHLPAKDSEAMNTDDDKCPETSLSITCQIGTQETDLSTLTFSGLPGLHTLSWFRHFGNQTRMKFTHTCTEQDFSAQAELQERHLCRGSVSCASGEARFSMVARRLRRGRLGLFCHNGDYCVLVFPGEGDGVHHAVKDGGGEPDCPLHYLIFKPSISLEPVMLAPLSFAGPRAGPHPRVTRDVPVFDTVFKFKFDQLLPSPDSREATQNFFLAFPPSAKQDACLIAQWLSFSHASCNVKTSLHPGSWSSFLKLNHGTLILHEDAVSAVHQFRKLTDILCAPNKNYPFFLFQKAEHLLHLPPARNLTSPSSESGKLLTPIFRLGGAFLMTPSFLVSQPQQAYVFVKWFWQNFSRNSQKYRLGKLVVSSDIQDWTLHLASRRQERKGINDGAQQEPGWAETGVKTWALLRGLIAESMDDDGGPIDFAPDEINGSDEQSLVNWFGWWAIVNMDRFRKFSVIGSGNHHASRLTASIPLPNYHKASEPPRAALGSRATEFAANAKQGAKLQLVANDAGTTFANFLARVDEAIRNEVFRPLALHKSAVSYWDPDMAFHFQDYTSVFHSFKAWVGAFADNVRPDPNRWGGRPNINSHAGFFYTIEDAWDRAIFPHGVKPNRRPWVAILRARNPHWRPWSSTELFIWDCKAFAQHSRASAVHLGDLLCAQRELVKLIQAESQTSFELPLQRVWLGGSTVDGDGGRFSEPIDIVLNWLANLPRTIKDLVPAPENKIPERNWKLVSGQAKLVESTSPDPMDVDEPQVEMAGLMSTIFQPPRVEGEPWRSECRNRLQDWADRVRKSNRSVTTADFTFESTMRWYTEQVQRGQGLHHVEVLPWGTAFSRLKIPDPKRVKDSGQTER